MEITQKPFGTTKNGEAVTLYRMENLNGSYVCLLDWGARIQALGMPDKNGNIVDVVCGFDSVQDYEKYSDTYIGAAIGRNANRLKSARFKLNNIVYNLSANEGKNQLHGGSVGFDSRMWDCVVQDQMISFYRNSPHMEEGYPGLLRMTINYKLSNINELIISYSAMSDADTLINPTNHSYFNLAGSGSIREHLLQLNAHRITLMDEQLIPTGEIVSVEDTPYDFTIAKTLGSALDQSHPQMTIGCGIDTNFILEDTATRPAAVLACPQSGIIMRCFTDMPCIQVYTANHLNTQCGKNNTYYHPYEAVCLETQRYPNAANCPGFPDVVLKAKDIFRSRTVYAFDCAKKGDCHEPTLEC